MRDTIDLKEFIDQGYLQELNRQFLHPHGLALSYVENEDGSVQINNIWDARLDPAGIVFAENAATKAKARNIAGLEDIKKPIRMRSVGYWVQPVEGLEDKV